MHLYLQPYTHPVLAHDPSPQDECASCGHAHKGCGSRCLKYTSKLQEICLLLFLYYFFHFETKQFHCLYLDKHECASENVHVSM